MSSSALGGSVSTHRHHVGRSALLIVAGVIMVGLALLISVRRERAPLTGEQLAFAIYGTAAAGIVLMAVGAWLRRGGWRQGDLGITQLGDPDGPWLYTQITQATSFLRKDEPSALAWRSLEGRTASTDTRIAHFQDFYDRFWSDYVAARVPQIRDTLAAGGKHEFAMVPHRRVKTRPVFTVRDYLEAETSTILLTTDTLKVGKLTVPLDQVDSVESEEWTERLTFLLLDGSTVGFDYTAVFDLPVLVSIVEELIEDHAEARR